MILSFLGGITLVKRELQVPKNNTAELISGAEPSAVISNEILTEKDPVIEKKINDKGDANDLYLKRGDLKQNAGENELSFEMKYKKLLNQLEKERFERELITGK